MSMHGEHLSESYKRDFKSTLFNNGFICHLSDSTVSEDVWIETYRDDTVVYLEYTRVSVPSSELGPPPHPPQASMSLPLDTKGGGGCPNSDDWIESLALCILCERKCTCTVHNLGWQCVYTVECGGLSARSN